jgi:hypothetical protein
MAERPSSPVSIHPCVVCAARGRARRPSPDKISRVTIQHRTLLMCREHAGMVAIKMPRTWDDLRSLFSAPAERRSPIVRRTEMSEDRRVFPPRPEGRRVKQGRRQSDPAD